MSQNTILLPFTVQQAVAAWHDSDTDPTNYNESGYNSCVYECGRNRSFLVMTEEDKDERVRESAESYVQEFVLSQIPEHLHFYFDEDKFIEDSLSDFEDSLASYDGNLAEIDIDSSEFRSFLLDCINEIRDLDDKPALKTFPHWRIEFDDGSSWADVHHESYYVCQR